MTPLQLLENLHLSIGDAATPKALVVTLTSGCWLLKPSEAYWNITKTEFEILLNLKL
jgi:hypothetical protein